MGKERKGKERKGKERKGKERKGKERKEKQRKEKKRKEKKRKEKKRKEKQSKANQTKPNQTKPNQTKPNQTKPNQTPVRNLQCPLKPQMRTSRTWMFFAPSKSRQRAKIWIMVVSKTTDHIKIKIKMPKPCQEPPVSSKAPNDD